MGGDIADRVTRTGGRAATTGVIRGRYGLSVGKPEDTSARGWQWTLLTDLARLETGHTPSRKHSEYWGGNIPWVGIRDATSNHGHTIHVTAENTNDIGIKNSSARVLPANTVCLSRTASVGYVVVMGVPMATSQDFVNWVCGPNLDYRYLKYVLLSEKSTFLQFASGTTHQTIYFPEVKAFHICLPPIEEQRAIADILSNIDDKIELNYRRASALEETARAIFKSWFVNFDPVCANMKGSSTSTPDALKTNFPDSFDGNGLPLGWTSQPLSALTRITKGSSYKSEHLTAEAETALVTLKSFRRGGGYRSDGLKRFSGPYKPAQQVEPGELVIAATDVTQAAEIVGQPVIVQSPNAAVTLVASLDTFIVRPLEESLTPIMLEGILRASGFPAFARGYCTGTTVLHLSARAFEDFLVPLPPASTLTALSEILEPLHQGQELAVRQSLCLTALRDLLLPKLISGELSIREAEAQVAAA